MEFNPIRIEPKMIDGNTIRLYGVGPTCPGCGGPTHAVTASESAERPWFCKKCSVRFDDEGGYGSMANFPAGNDPNE